MMRRESRNDMFEREAYGRRLVSVVALLLVLAVGCQAAPVIGAETVAAYDARVIPATYTPSSPERQAAAAAGSLPATSTLPPPRSSAEAYANRCAGNLAVGRLQEALADCTEAIGRDTEFADGYYNRGLVYIGMGQVALARADFERFLELEVDERKRRNAQEVLAGLGE